MGFWSRLLGIDAYDAAQRVLPAPYEPYMATGGIPVMDPGSPLQWWAGGERTKVENFWRTQPNLRKVVDFAARATASVPLNAYRRVSDTDRHRVHGEPIAQALAAPRPRVGPYRFWHSLVSDLLLYDRWCFLVATASDGTPELQIVPAWRTRFEVDALNTVTDVYAWMGDKNGREGDEQWKKLPFDQVVFDHGYGVRSAGLSPVDTLSDILEENAEAVRYRREVWENGTRAPAYIARPQDAGSWTPEQRQRFASGLKSVYGKDAPNAGGMPILEDGMEIKGLDVFSPQDAGDIEGRQLTAVEVASAFHIAPELVGAREGTFSNIEAYRQGLYRDALGPLIKSIEDALNAQLVPMLTDDPSVYVEANIEAKLRGSFEEQAKIMQSATGGPWMTRNEARAMQNRPPLEGGDDLIVPLNVIAGGQASPNDSGSQNIDSPREGA